MYLAGSYFYSPTGTIQTGQWHHVALVRVNRVFLLYVDGVATWMTAYAASNINDDGNLYLGSAENSENAHLDGLLDEFRDRQRHRHLDRRFHASDGRISARSTGGYESLRRRRILFVISTVASSTPPATTRPSRKPARWNMWLASSTRRARIRRHTIRHHRSAFSDWQIGTGDCSLDCWIRLPANYTTGRYILRPRRPATVRL